MSLARCLLELIDDVRDEMGITPPNFYDRSDPRWGPPGTQPARALEPNNPTIKRALNKMLDIVNNKTGFHGVNINIPIPEQFQQGYLEIPMDMSQFIPAVLPNIGVGNFNTVRRVNWDNGTYGSGSVNWTQVLPTEEAYFDRNQQIQDNMQPGTPQYYFLRSGSIWITPPNSIAGYYNIGGGTGLLSLETDTGYIDQLPVGYHQVIVLGAAEICERRKSGSDVEAREMLAAFSQPVLDGILDIQRWYKGENEQNTPRVGMVNLRQPAGCRRRWR